MCNLCKGPKPGV
ncbi:hypothetical protein IFM89_026718 [Coptis chinensis]|uniref:Uncharacterized protein n=1 Tax=Coptis chinensis TaxID=261450 RepID=A0A835H7D0_9MAGN|nr:hypothetical protein IFM89_026718 [Coptis chinensis]